MDRELLEFTVADQWNELSKRTEGFPRQALKEAGELAGHKAVVVITGHRRVGKSTLLKQIMGEYYPGGFYYLNFADERLNDFQASDFQALHEIFVKKFGEKKTFFLDEIQGKGGWDKFVNRLHESGNKFFITGSNAELLSTEISTFLTGRHLDLSLYPFSFKEFLECKKIPLFPETTAELAAKSNAFEQYIENGGFPEAAAYGDTSILQAIYEDVINKDVIVREKIRDVKTFKDMALFLLSNTGRETTFNSLKNQFNLGSPNTAKNYVHHLTKAFMLFEVNRFGYSLKKQEFFPKKIYCIDTGLANKMAFKTSKDYGRSLENLVFLELKRRKKQVYYWKNESSEVDFLIVEKNKVIGLIQVCADANDKKTRERETKALENAMAEFKLNASVIITANEQKIEEKNRRTIHFTPIQKWLVT